MTASSTYKSATYTRIEFRRLFRNRQNLALSLIVPLVLLYAIGGTNAHTIITGDITYARYYLAGMIGFGAMGAVLAGGARIAVERQIGWTRQLRITPLPPWAYLRAKVVTTYALALISLILLTLAGLSLGVRLPFTQWLQIVGLVLVALLPFAALGVLLGHLIRGDAMGPVIGLGTSGFTILGGGYFPIGEGHGFMHEFVRLIPSFWLIQAGKTGVGGQGWTPEAWFVVLVWAAALGTAAAWAYRRDTARA